MRYDYTCKQHDPPLIFEVQHGMTESPTVLCPECNSVARRVIGASYSIVIPEGGRSIRLPNRRSNKEYRAYRRWENNGGEPDDPLRKDFLAARGDNDKRK